ncbi:MAG TPA: M23 family metallopeptidase [Pyrinomonadaceae bacterium]|nr:M23 family metallopeptidase [Pyrinomonadaceae bacterium]
MQKDSRFFSFLFSNKSSSRIYIRRVHVSKKLVQNGFLSLAILLGLSALGAGVAGVSSLSTSNLDLASAAPVSQTAKVRPTSALSIDYSRPAESSRMALNSGGPVLSENSLDDAELEAQLRVIETTSDPASLPNMWALMGKINNEYGFRRNPFGGRTYEFHAGMDIDGERGDQVLAPGAGRVVKAGWHGGYGNMIEIDHGNGLITRYGHMSKLAVSEGDTVGRGMLIGYVGSTGRSTGPHLHYELLLGDRAINPRRMLPAEPTEIGRS